MNIAYTTEEKVQNIYRTREKDFVANKFNALVIEEDYVSYLYLKEVLTTLKFTTYRAISFDDAFLEPFNIINYDLIILNISLFYDNNISTIKYLRNVYPVPIVIVDNGENKKAKYQEIIDLVDGVVSLNTDNEYFAETISDILGE